MFNAMNVFIVLKNYSGVVQMIFNKIVFFDLG
jgi:hypothetical protein